MQKIFVGIMLLLLSFSFFSCGEDVKTPTDTLSTGNILVEADESFKPIIEEELKVFDSSFPDAHVKIVYKPEAECLKDFMKDTTRLIIVTRDLSKEEKQDFEQRKIVTTSLSIAKDAIAIVVNNSCTDSLFSISQIRGILNGKFAKKYTVVCDNQGSSVLRYLLDSIIPGEQLAANVFAAKGKDSLINYVANNPNAIGFISVSDVSDFGDPEGLAFINKVKVVEIFNEKWNSSFKPYQAYIAPNKYPFTRKIFYIHKETYPGLGTGFANFMSRDRGQLIFKQSRLFPLRADVIFREAAINN
jgi:phosphate transport system substrate-binding protein